MKIDKAAMMVMAMLCVFGAWAQDNAIDPFILRNEGVRDMAHLHLYLQLFAILFLWMILRRPTIIRAMGS